MAGVGKFDKIQKAEQDKFRYYWQKTQSFKKKNTLHGKFLEEYMPNCDQYMLSLKEEIIEEFLIIYFYNFDVFKGICYNITPRNLI